MKNYFANNALITDDPAFLDDISLRFSMTTTTMCRYWYPHEAVAPIEAVSDVRC